MPLAIADSLGAKALVVDPVDESAEAFRARSGFERIPGLERMLVPLSQPDKRGAHPGRVFQIPRQMDDDGRRVALIAAARSAPC